MQRIAGILDKIRIKRAELKLSQENVAEAIGVKFQTYQQLEAGKTKMTVERLLDIADKAFKCNVLELMPLTLLSKEQASLLLNASKLDTEWKVDVLKLQQQLTDAATLEAVSWKSHADKLMEANLKLQEEKDELKAELVRLKKTSKLYSTEEESHLTLVAEPALKKKTSKQLHKH